MRFAVFALLIPCLFLSALARETEVDPLLAALGNPPATGYLITSVADGTQAMELGLVPGCVIVSYAGKPTPTLEALNAAKKAVAVSRSVQMEVVLPGGKKVALDVKPGQIGVTGMNVVKGKPPAPLPAATDVKFDFSSLKKAPVDLWFAFSLDGKTKAGFEHQRLSLEGDRLTLHHEVAFHGGEEWGPYHADVTVVITTKPRPEALSVRFEQLITKWTGESKLQVHEDGSREWRQNWKNASDDSSGAKSCPAPAGILPTYILEPLAGFMPREKGASFHYRPVGDGSAELMLPAALYCAGDEEIEHEGENVTATKIEARHIGGDVAGTYWIGPDGHTLRVDYNGAMAWRTTKEKALAGLPEGIKPR